MEIIQRLQKKVEKILEPATDINFDEIERNTQKFEINHDLAKVKDISIGLPQSHTERITAVFSRLSFHFQAGILLENHDSQWVNQAFFYRGETHLIPNKLRKKMPIPQNQFDGVWRTDSAKVLKHFQLIDLDKYDLCSCLLIKATPDYAILLFSPLPDLWLKELSEKVQEQIIYSFA